VKYWLLIVASAIAGCTYIEQSGDSNKLMLDRDSGVLIDTISESTSDPD